MKQANKIQAGLAKDKINIKSDKEIIALIAYLQRVGTDIKLEQKTATNN
jgi:cytochrome c oxidase cbb3-type subunit I/II